MSVLWSAGFVVAGTLMGLALGIFDRDSIDPGEGPLQLLSLFALLGAIAGSMFAVVMMLGERRRTFRDLTLSRMAVWGAIGGAALPLVLGKDPRMMLIFGSLGSLLSTGLLALARRASDPPGVAGKEDERALPHPTD